MVRCRKLKLKRASVMRGTRSDPFIQGSFYCADIYFGLYNLLRLVNALPDMA